MISKEPSEDTVRREFKTNQNIARQLLESAASLLGVTTETRNQKVEWLASHGGGSRMEPATEISGLFHMESNVAQAAEGNR